MFIFTCEPHNTLKTSLASFKVRFSVTLIKTDNAITMETKDTELE